MIFSVGNRSGRGKRTAISEKKTDDGKPVILRRSNATTNLSNNSAVPGDSTWSCSEEVVTLFDTTGWVIKSNRNERCSSGYSISSEESLQRVTQRRYPIEKEIKLERLDLIKRRE